MKYLNIIFLLISFSLISQNISIDNDLYEGNEKVKNEDYLGAEMDYRLALTRSPEASKALFNLGNAQYQANAYDEAALHFFRTQKLSDNKTEKHAALHNIGNVYMKKKEYEKAVESYKSALRNNPSDDETRYNYALAKSLLEDEKKNKDKKDEDKQKNKDQKGDEDENKKSSNKDDKGDKEKDEKKGESDKEDQKQSDKENQKDPDKSNPNKKRKPSQLSKEQVKSLLEAMNNQEKKVQDKINAKKVKGKPVKTKKDW